MNHWRMFFRWIIILLLVSGFGRTAAQESFSICSWNLQNFSNSKPDSAIAYISEILRDFDIVALQEVVAGYGGKQVVARLHDELQRKGTKWDYFVSEATNGRGPERYAFLWKTARIKAVGKPFFEQYYADSIDREPYFLKFSTGTGRHFTIVNFHAVPKKKFPEQEIKYFKFFPDRYSGHNLIFLGDFNCPQNHSVFNPLKGMGYAPALTRQRTTLKQECVGSECLASEYDNIFYPISLMQLVRSGIVPFYKDFPSMGSARKLSDHVPVYFYFQFKK